MTIFRRTLLIWLWMFWQGGFLFYGSVVVTIGSSVLESDLEQGLITRHVTLAINITGVIVLLAWLWDLFAEPHTHNRKRWATWLLLFVSIVLLFWLRANLETHIDPVTHRLMERANFRRLHRWYLRVSTVQLIAAMAFTVWTLQTWMARDKPTTAR